MAHRPSLHREHIRSGCDNGQHPDRRKASKGMVCGYRLVQLSDGKSQHGDQGERATRPGQKAETRRTRPGQLASTARNTRRPRAGTRGSQATVSFLVLIVFLLFKLGHKAEFATAAALRKIQHHILLGRKRNTEN